MKDKYLMDTNKMMWHPDRVQEFLDGKQIAPLHIDVGLSKGCNIRCHYCFGVLQGNFYKKGADIYFPRKPLLNYMRSAGECGVRSMGFIGEAEPTMNPHLYEAIDVATKSGIDVSLGTNGILFDMGDKGRKALEQLKWIRFNISAASDKAYRKLHGSKEFNKLIDVVKFCVKTKKDNDLPVTIGFQSVLTPQDIKEMVPLANLGKELGIDYHVIKQCSDNQDSDLGFYDRYGEYKTFTDFLKDAESVSSGNYDVIVKWKNISSCGVKDYDNCMGMPFLLYSSGDGKLFGCGMFFDKKWWDEWLIGDLTKNTFKEIIHSDRYKKIVNKHANIDCHSFCYSECRTNSINSYVWKLLHPPKHKNFV